VGLFATVASSWPLWLKILIVAVDVVWLLAALLATVWFLGGRLRLSIEYLVGKDADKGAALEVLGHLGELGGEGIRGVEYPTAPDVSVLKDEPLSAIAGDGVVKALLSALNAVFGTVPWEVRVSEATSGASEQTVAVSRNGRTLFSRVIRTIPLHITAVGVAEPLAPRTFVAAAILTTLAEHYAGFDGLNGATDYRSIALTVVARRDFVTKPGAAFALAALAARTDPGNDTAQQLEMFLLYRTSSNGSAIRAYSDWALQRLDDPGWPRGVTDPAVRRVLRLRLLTNYVGIVRNLVAAAGYQPTEVPVVLPQAAQSERRS